MDMCLGGSRTPKGRLGVLMMNMTILGRNRPVIGRLIRPKMSRSMPFWM